MSGAMAVPFFYAVTEIVLISTYCVCAWKLGWTKAPPEQPFCKVLLTSYELEQSHYDLASKNSALDEDTVADTTIVHTGEEPVEEEDNV